MGNESVGLNHEAIEVTRGHFVVEIPILEESIMV